MIPQTVISPETFVQFEITVKPSKTFRIDFATGRITGIIDDGAEAVRQAVYCILNTERYQYLIHSHDYGIELYDLYGQQKQYVFALLQNRIREALMQDDRIEDVSSFKFDAKGKSYAVEFEVITHSGDNIMINYKAGDINV